jgi:hypothetical protein
MSGAGQSVSKARFTFLVVMIAAALACGTVPVTLTVPPGPAKPTAAPTLYFSLHQLHFENEVVAFEYPEGLQVHQAGDANWRVHPDVDLGGELLVGLGDPRQSHSERYYRSISIARRLAPVQHTDLARLMTEVYAQLVIEPADAPIGGVPGADGPITVNGHSAIQKVSPALPCMNGAISGFLWTRGSSSLPSRMNGPPTRTLSISTWWPTASCAASS